MPETSVSKPEDSDPEKPGPVVPLLIPVRRGPAGMQVTRLMQTPMGRPTAVAFTTHERLCSVLGAEQETVRLALPALRSMIAPLGIAEVIVDPYLSARPSGWSGPSHQSVPGVRASAAPR